MDNLNPGLDHPLLSVCFTDINTGYICGQKGEILKTENGGANWSVQATSLKFGGIYNMHFPGPDVGYFVGMNGTMVKFTAANF